MASITSTVRDFKREPERYLPDQMIHDALGATQHRWRDRLLGPVLTVQLMVLQVLMGNVSGRSLLRRVGVACCKHPTERGNSIDSCYIGSM